MIGVGTRGKHPKAGMTREQKIAAHRQEAAVRILIAQASREMVPLWRKHVIQPLIGKALGRLDANDDVNPEPIYQWFLTNHARIVKSQARLQQGTLGIKADAHSPRVQAALAKGRDDARALITKASADLESDLDDVLKDPANFGLRHEEIRDLLLDRGNVSESRARLIARDQTSRVNAAVARAGHEDAGFDRYIWSTSLDERVRPSHQILEGQVFSYAVGGPEGNPGDPISCRCVAVPYEED